MRRMFPVISFLLFLFLLSGCKKDTTIHRVSVIGSWELRVSYNGLGGSTNYPAGNGRIVKFTASHYQNFDSGQLVKSGTYEIVKDTYHLTNQLKNRIIYDKQYDNTLSTFVEFTDNKLVFSIDAYDAPGAEYEKQ